MREPNSGLYEVAIGFRKFWAEGHIGSRDLVKDKQIGGK